MLCQQPVPLCGGQCDGHVLLLPALTLRTASGQHADGSFGVAVVGARVLSGLFLTAPLRPRPVEPPPIALPTAIFDHPLAGCPCMTMRDRLNSKAIKRCRGFDKTERMKNEAHLLSATNCELRRPASLLVETIANIQTLDDAVQPPWWYYHIRSEHRPPVRGSNADAPPAKPVKPNCEKGGFVSKPPTPCLEARIR